MTFELRPFGKDQIHEAARIAVTSHGNNPFRRIVLPNGKGQEGYDKLYKDLNDLAEDQDSHLLQLYDTDAGKMAAIGVWKYTKPMSDEEWDRRSDERQNAYPDARQEIAQPFLRKEGEARKNIMGQERWWGM